MENIPLVGSTYRDKRKYTLKVGDYDIVTFDVNDRYISNGHRRPKNMAVHICMNQVGPGYANIYGVGNSVTVALGCLKRLGVPLDEFIAMLVECEWSDQIPLELLPEGNGSSQLHMRLV